MLGRGLEEDFRANRVDIIFGGEESDKADESSHPSLMEVMHSKKNTVSWNIALWLAESRIRRIQERRLFKYLQKPDAPVNDHLITLIYDQVMQLVKNTQNGAGSYNRTVL
jgi:hypothetical protein